MAAPAPQAGAQFEGAEQQLTRAVQRLGADAKQVAAGWLQQVLATVWQAFVAQAVVAWQLFC